MCWIIKFEAAPDVTHVSLDQAYDQLTVRSAHSELYNIINFEVAPDILFLFFLHNYNAHAIAAIRLVTTSRKKNFKYVQLSQVINVCKISSCWLDKSAQRSVPLSNLKQPLISLIIFSYDCSWL